MATYSHLSNLLLGKVVRKKAQKAIRNLRKHEDKFDNIAFMGISGALLAPIIAAGLDKNLWAVRKEKSVHSYNTVETNFDVKDGGNFIIVDDFIDSGVTVQKILEEIKLQFPSSPFYGIYMYAIVYPPNPDNPYFKELQLSIVDGQFIHKDLNLTRQDIPKL